MNIKILLLILAIVIILFGIFFFITQGPTGVSTSDLKTQVAPITETTLAPDAYSDVSLDGLNNNIGDILSGGAKQTE